MEKVDTRDLNKRVVKFRNRLTKKLEEVYAKEQQYGFRVIIETIFDQYLGQAIPLPALAALTIQKIPGVTQFDYKELTEALIGFIKLPSNRNWLDIRSGKNGGVRRIKDWKKAR